MNTYYVSDPNFLNSTLYREFIENNSSGGTLRIRAYAASQAIPIGGLKIVISTNYKNNIIVFYEGYTNESGVIEKINLPTPELDQNNLDVPNYTTYEIKATYIPDNINSIYKVNMYEDIVVIQNINIVPNSGFTNVVGDKIGS